MRHSKRILIAVDESDASRRAVDYVAEVSGGGTGFQVALLHLELPPRMFEWGGSENPETEEEVSGERGRTYRQIEQKALVKSEARLEPFRALLAKRGIEAAVLLVQFEEPLDRKNIAESVLKTAKERDYGTVVVGRRLFSLWESFFQHHVGEQLVRTSDEITIWVVA
jgi:nucleotide-binding universal stress UspA family protein